MATEYQIKRVTTDDVKELQDISRITFSETFAADNTQENIDVFLNEAYDQEKLINEINNTNSEFYFLIVDEQVVGYLKVNQEDAQTEQVAVNALVVERIYLKQSFQHQGLGLVLIKLAERIARKKSRTNIWLGVWEENYNAQKFYEKDGFHRVSEHRFVIGDDVQTDYILVKELN